MDAQASIRINTVPKIYYYTDVRTFLMVTSYTATYLKEYGVRSQTSVETILNGL